ncbi:protein CutA homolog [Onthophagus taurus]|uniref:protein CutA homolog n=1 Tax=Onthophagus taurus TaxID=166361 RepID=UPI000C204DF4|nr:protein CutA homolog [Onthophagus taurus]
MIFKRSILFSTLILGLVKKSPLASQNTQKMSNSYVSGTHSAAYVTAPNEEVAKKIAHGLVSHKLAACVNIIPKITSVYEWEGKIEEDSEVLMMIKTRSTKIPELTEFVKSNHPYTVCEVISIPIEGGNQQYLNWIGDVVPNKN